MWRWLHSLPRAVRQQCGSGASAVHVDDLHENETTVQTKQQTGQWKVHCRQRQDKHKKEENGSRPNSHDFWKMVHGPYSPIDAIRLGSLVALGVNMGQFKCLHWQFRQQEGQHRPCLLSKVLLRSMQTSSSALPRASRYTGPIVQQNDATAESKAGTSSTYAASNEGSSMGGTRSTYSGSTEGDSTGEGTSISTDSTAGNSKVGTRSESSDRQREPRLQLQEEKTQQAAQKAQEIESLEEAFSNFETVCKKYTSVGKGIMGLQEAESGNMKAAIELWKESGKLGHSKSVFNLALCYELGIGVKKDLGEAMRLYKLGAEDLHPQSMYNLGVLYMEGSTHTARDTKKGLNLISTAADFGLPEAQCYLGVHFSQEGSENAGKAIHYLTLAANQQHAEGQYMLGMCYQHGYGVEENMCKAADLYSKAAEKSHPDALYNLAVFHSQGLAGLPKDVECGDRLMRKAAECGSHEAREILELENTNNNLSVIKQTIDTTKSELAEEQSSMKYTFHLNNSVSSPCLTDLLRENMILVDKNLMMSPVSDAGTLSQLYTQLMVPRGFTMTPSVTKLPKSGSVTPTEDSDSGVLFKLGLDSDSDDSVDVVFSNSDSMDVFPVSSSRNSSSLQRRISTMPDLNCIQCP